MSLSLLVKAFLLFTISGFSLSCTSNNTAPKPPGVQLVVLGITQDAGFNQLGCEKSCCLSTEPVPLPLPMVSCLAIYDPSDSMSIFIDATPDITEQMVLFNDRTGANQALPDALFLTHAHIGHYAGLMYLGREAAGTEQLPVYAMPRMQKFLKSNGPWSLLVENSYINLMALQGDSTLQINANISITPLVVPHRDEFSETVGYIVTGPRKRILYIPDIDKWERWNHDINQLITEVDLAFLDGTFYDGYELPGRDMSEIPHPFISESMARFGALSEAERSKVHFIHLNHTNQAFHKKSNAGKKIREMHFKVAEQGMKVNI